MRVWVPKGHKPLRTLGAKKRMSMCDVVIHNGVILKNRHGKPFQRIGGSAYIWDEEVHNPDGDMQ